LRVRRVADFGIRSRLGRSRLSHFVISRCRVYDTVKRAVKNMVRTRRTYRPREKERRIYSSSYEKHKKIY